MRGTERQRDRETERRETGRRETKTFFFLVHLRGGVVVVSLSNPAERRQEEKRTCIRQHTSAQVSIRQHTSAYVSIRQHTSAYVSGEETRGEDDMRLDNEAEGAVAEQVAAEHVSASVAESVAAVAAAS